jgi:hypothetical protein
MYTFVYACASIAHYVWSVSLSNMESRCNRRSGTVDMVDFRFRWLQDICHVFRDKYMHLKCVLYSGIAQCVFLDCILNAWPREIVKPKPTCELYIFNLQRK